MALTVYNGTAWVDAIEVKVYNGTAWVAAQDIVVANGSGGWATAWTNHYHEIVPAGGSIQAAMNRARDWHLAYKTLPVNFDDEQTMACVELTAGATYNLGSTELFYRRGVRLIGNGATIRGASTTHIFKNDNNGGGSYNSPNTDFLIKNVVFDCANYSGGISTSHTKRFRLDGVTIKNIGGKKHNLEINSSGGARQDGTYNCQVLNCTFFQTTKSTAPEAARAEDECIQLDYSWTGAAPAVAADGTVTNNVRIEGCEFYNAPRAFGGHHYQAESGNASPKGIHSNILFKGNYVHDIDPQASAWGDGANSANSEGAVRAYMWSNVYIQDNIFERCYQPICLYIPGDAVTTHGNPNYFYVRGNTIRNKTSTRPAIYGIPAHASLKLEEVDVENNIVDGTWGGTDYFIGFDSTGGLLPASTYGAVYRGNTFKPSNLTAQQQKDYNKYRAGNATNVNGVYIAGNLVSDGTVDNS